VSVARDLSPDTGSRAGLYAVISHAPPRLTAEQRPDFEYLDSASASFACYAAVRAAACSDEFYRVPAAGVDVCNVQVPIRPPKSPRRARSRRFRQNRRANLLACTAILI
jgi:hypothetical protein